MEKRRDSSETPNKKDDIINYLCLCTHTVNSHRCIICGCSIYMSVGLTNIDIVTCRCEHYADMHICGICDCEEYWNIDMNNAINFGRLSGPVKKEHRRFMR